MKSKIIQCKDCSKVCESGLKGLCKTCYNSFLKKKTKENNQREKKKIKTEKERDRKSIRVTNLQNLINTIVRLGVGPKDNCITCKNEFTGVCKLNAGHCFVASKPATRFYLKNIHPQCSCCNLKQHMEGNVDMYLILEEKYGEEFMTKMNKMSKVSYKFANFELRELRDKAKETIDLLEKTTLMVNRKKIIEDFIIWQEQTEWFKNIENLIK